MFICGSLKTPGTFAAFPFPALSADLAAVVRLTPGLGYAHVFSLFNMAFSIGAFVSVSLHIRGLCISRVSDQKEDGRTVARACTFLQRSTLTPAWPWVSSNDDQQVGPIIAGQVLESLGIEKGWYTMLGVTIGCYVVCIPGIILKYSAHKLDDKQVTTAETLPTHTHTGETE